MTCLEFPEDTPWYQTADELAVHPSSDAYIASIESMPDFTMDTFHAGFDAEFGAAYSVVTDPVPDTVPVEFVDQAAQDESHPGPYVIPVGASTNDGYAVVVTTPDASRTSSTATTPRRTPWTHAEAVPGSSTSTRSSNLPTSNARRSSRDCRCFPCSCATTRSTRAVSITPCCSTPRRSRATSCTRRHSGAGDGDTDNLDLPPLGSRFRLKADFDCNSMVTSEAATVCVTLKTYGMYLGGSSGSLFDLQGVTDPRFTDDFLDDIKQMVPTDFEVVDTGEELR